MERVAVINTCFDRSTGKIAHGLYCYCKRSGYDSLYCYGRGPEKGDPHPEKTNADYYLVDTLMQLRIHAGLCRITGIQGCYSKGPTKNLIELLRKRKVDTVFGVGLHGYYLNEELFFDFLKEDDIRFVYVMADEYPFLGQCGYRNGCINYKSGCFSCPQVKEYPKSLFFDRSHSVFERKQREYADLKHAVFVAPEYVIEEAKTSPLMANQDLRVVDEAIDVSKYRPRDASQLRESLGIESNKIVLVCIAPLSYERKGVKYYIELARLFEGNDDFAFVQVGYDEDYPEGLPSNYIAVGYEADQDKLCEYYSLADLFVFPSLLDTMPNACLEALACGSPLLCFNVSGMPYIADEKTATFVEPKNVRQLADVVIKVRKKDQEIIDICRKYALERYDNRKYYEKLVDIANSLG